MGIRRPLLDLDNRRRPATRTLPARRLQRLALPGSRWRLIPNDLPPWHTVYQQTQRWLQAGAFETLVHDLRALLRLLQSRRGQPSAVALASRILQSTSESGACAAYDGAKRRKGSKT
jgi:transposase